MEEIIIILCVKSPTHFSFIILSFFRHNIVVVVWVCCTIRVIKIMRGEWEIITKSKSTRIFDLLCAAHTWNETLLSFFAILGSPHQTKFHQSSLSLRAFIVSLFFTTHTTHKTESFMKYFAIASSKVLKK